jgi:hypothetical protein
MLDLRAALERLAPFYRAPSGNALHLNGTDDAENLYLLAMGDRTAYGATGGEILSWTRGPELLQRTSNVSVDSGIYNCILDHVSSANTKPGTGGQWQTYWAAGYSSDAIQNSFTAWASGVQYGVHKTYDIDIGEIAECVALLEGSSLMPDPV